METEAVIAELVKIVENELPKLQRQAADKKDIVALRYLDVIWAFEKQDDPERLALIVLLQMRLKGYGRVSAVSTITALGKLIQVTGGLL